LGQVNHFGVNAAHASVRTDDELHRRLSHFDERMMRRRGRSTSRPSSADWTPES
jgi:hypothetical protein